MSKFLARASVNLIVSLIVGVVAAVVIWIVTSLVMSFIDWQWENALSYLGSRLIMVAVWMWIMFSLLEVLVEDD